jgi:putative transposase
VSDLVEPDHKILSVRRQCALLGVARSSLNYQAVSERPEEAGLRRKLDELYLCDPCLGSRRLAAVLARDCGLVVNRKRLQRVRREMGLEAIYCRRSTSMPGKGHRIFPYLLRGLEIQGPGQVWCADITYVPMERGHGYLCAVMDWYSRKVLGWELSNTMDVSLCLAALNQALKEALASPQIFNTDQGSQFTSEPWLNRLEEVGIAISMDGRGRWRDNVFIERLWRSVKYEEIYLHGYRDLESMRRGLESWFERYNTWRPHEALGNRTPEDVHRSRGESKSMNRKKQLPKH